MIRTFKYRLFPTKSQITEMNTQLELCRQLYNWNLNVHKENYESGGDFLTYFDMNAKLKELKKEQPKFALLYSQVAQNVMLRCDDAYKNFFRRVKNHEVPGYPRFKGYGRYDSMTYPQMSVIRIDNNCIKIPKIGKVRFDNHRDMDGIPKTMTVRRQADNKWYVFIVCDNIERHREHGKGSVGIDLGVKIFATLSDGNTIDNPKYYEHNQKIIAKANRRLSKAKTGTPERAKMRKELAHAHDKINNRRNDFLHKTANRLIANHGALVFEKLCITGMVEGSDKHNLNKSIMSCAWNRLTNICQYKAEEAGIDVIFVNPRNTSQMCSGCGQIVAKGLNDRQHICPYCGLDIDRDLNASKNILAIGLDGIGKSIDANGLQPLE